MPSCARCEEQLLGAVAGPLWVLFGAVGIVLLIACANVANLFMVRAERRQRELAVRRAIGAGRGQLFRSQMAEALVVAVLAGRAGARCWRGSACRCFSGSCRRDIPRIGEVGFNAMHAAVHLGAAFVASLACGVLPAHSRLASRT